jgi:hypothetical protein
MPKGDSHAVNKSFVVSMLTLVWNRFKSEGFGAQFD